MTTDNGAPAMDPDAFWRRPSGGGSTPDRPGGTPDNARPAAEPGTTGQTSGGQTSGGQTSGGQTSGGQAPAGPGGGQGSGGQGSGGQGSGSQGSGSQEAPGYAGPPPTTPPPAGWRPPLEIHPAPPRVPPAQDHAGLDAAEQKARTLTFGIGMVAGAILLIVVCALCSRVVF